MKVDGKFAHVSRVPLFRMAVWDGVSLIGPCDSCAAESRMSRWNDIRACYDGSDGVLIESAAEAATNAVHVGYTPFVVVNGVHSEAAEGNLVQVPNFPRHRQWSGNLNGGARPHLAEFGSVLQAVCAATPNHAKPSGCPVQALSQTGTAYDEDFVK
jgi:hypothetical protein